MDPALAVCEIIFCISESIPQKMQFVRPAKRLWWFFLLEIWFPAIAWLGLSAQISASKLSKN
tara:strand:- start:2893 stop:3078 length:186 start_codon:yes stop_codon:yes gene_type:complete